VHARYLLRPVIPEEITKDLAFALQHDGRRKVHNADRVIARLIAERLVKHLEMSGLCL
jgi:hypothetical protein